MAIALVDCNSFFCSCEAVFRPDLENKPVIVLSNNDGCVVSRNRQAKDLGIGMGQPFFQVRELADKMGVHYFSSNYALYADLSSRVMQTLAPYTPNMEVYSVDEAFLDFSGLGHVDLLAYAKAIKQQVWKNVRIPVSIGIGPTKVLAKLANAISKKNAEDPGGGGPVHPTLPRPRAFHRGDRGRVGHRQAVRRKITRLGHPQRLGFSRL